MFKADFKSTFIIISFFGDLSFRKYVFCVLSFPLPVMEMVGKKYRAHAGVFVSLPWCFGMFVLDGIAYMVKDWQTLELIVSCYTVLYLLLFW